MNKYTILTLACFSILPCFTSAAETYVEYFHMTKENPTLELGEGEIAEVTYATNEQLRIDLKIGELTFNNHFLYHGGGRVQAGVFAGPITIIFGVNYISEADKQLAIFKVTRIPETTASNGDSTTTPDPQATDYLSMDGWLFFTEFPWVYSSRNDSWYYLTAADDKLFAFNENIGGTNWMTLDSDN